MCSPQRGQSTRGILGCNSPELVKRCASLLAVSVPSRLELMTIPVASGLNATGDFPFRNAAMLSLRSKMFAFVGEKRRPYATWPGSIVFGVCSASCLVRGAGGSSGEPFTPPSSRSASSSSVVRSRRCDFGRITGRDIGASDERRPHPVFDAGWGRSSDFTIAGLFAVHATWTLQGENVRRGAMFRRLIIAGAGAPKI